jgi:hypothetical protein
MFMLYALLIGVALGVLSGGRIDRLGRLSIRWPWLIAAGMLIQLALFSSPVGAAVGDAGPAVYLATHVAVLAAVVANVAIPGLRLVALGALSNLAAIAANGGYMPVSGDALAAMGRGAEVGYSNSRLVDAPVLVPLTDVFSMPTWIPMANVFSIGDVLISAGVLVAVLATVHGRAPLDPTLGLDQHAAPTAGRFA